jgi:predicted transcriptional regulator
MASTVTVELDDGTLAALDEIAETTERSRTSLVTLAVQNYVELNAWHVEKIKAGIAAADRGDFASDEELERLRAKFRPHE